ncbi:MAG: UDP-N-acetylmuramate--L-alanine ligase [Saprospiraceae bacterium]|nr:MAG: UDP-N-acetylmuramate--L-alanine ligase [Bacteroidetes bacterium OLB9]MCO6463476.1 UDP-N-acetylmuramate--L-alanine ligase [Saprospiraceae bacterium]
MKLDDPRHVYFLGIGGIGMSAIARYLLKKGKRVSGYDRTHTVLTGHLQEEGMNIHYEDNIDLIPGDIDLVIYTPAIPKNHNEYNYLRDKGIQMLKRSEALGLIGNDMELIGVAGTHGKTTTSSMVTHVLRSGGLDISAFLGGIMVDYETNVLIGHSNVIVVEADEYDHSFLRLTPFIASVSSVDPDHLDIYGDRSHFIEGFRDYIMQIKDGGFLIIRYGLLDKFTKEERVSIRSKNITIYEYGQEAAADIRVQNIRVKDGKFVFDYSGIGHHLEGMALNMPGQHNVENACVAITIGLILGVVEQDIRAALKGFKGVHRRFERIIDREDMVYIDDYAHHPGELSAAIDAARMMYSGKKLTGIFQPHLYTRTRDFAEDFAETLDRLDEIILMDIYPARELPIEGVSSELIFEMMKNPNKRLATKATLMDVIKEYQPEVLITFGAGDIDTFVPKLKAFFNK